MISPSVSIHSEPPKFSPNEPPKLPPEIPLKVSAEVPKGVANRRTAERNYNYARRYRNTNTSCENTKLITTKQQLHHTTLDISLPIVF